MKAKTRTIDEYLESVSGERRTALVKLRTLAKEIARYEHTKSSLHFDSKTGLPASLVGKLLKARIAEVRRARGTLAGRAASAPRGGRTTRRVILLTV